MLFKYVCPSEEKYFSNQCWIVYNIQINEKSKLNNNKLVYENLNHDDCIVANHLGKPQKIL